MAVYSDPTYVAIRSGKRSSSEAISHGLDLETLLDLKDFDDIERVFDEKFYIPFNRSGIVRLVNRFLL